MRPRFRAGLVARLLLTGGALLPYWPFLTFRVLYVTDDYFASDIFNGELPGRILIGQLIRQGHWPTWTTQLCSGLPLAGVPLDPIGIAAFALLPPAPALDLFVIALLLIAAHGAYTLAERFGADRTGAFLAGIAFAGCGYFACQLKHLAIVATVAWLPLALALLDGALEPGDQPWTRRARRLAAFGLVFAIQALSGFPQSAYICGLVYVAFTVFRTMHGRERSWRSLGPLLTATGVAAALGAAAGAVILLPLSAVASVSDRAESGWDWATRLAYWPPNAITFLFPYANGDIANNTYTGPPFFWEDYGYIGILTFLLAIYGGIRWRRSPLALFAAGMTVAAYLLVLGPATPFYRVVYLLVPGISMFRFPQRFLIVVELGLALLAALGVTSLRRDLAARLGGGSLIPQVIAVTACVLTVGDLTIHQPRQNPMVPAREWLAPPPTVAAVHVEAAQPRTFTPRHRDIHRQAFQQAHGWADVTPYRDLRDLLEPNTGGAFWNTPSADCYAGVAPRWYTDVWGDHNREVSLMAAVSAIDFRAGHLVTRPAFANLLRAYGVTHVLSPYSEDGTGLAFEGRIGNAYVYRVNDARRVRFVSGATTVATEDDAARRLLDPAFDPNREVLLHGASGPVHPTVQEGSTTALASASAVILREGATDLLVNVDAPSDGLLLLADTIYPGWSVAVDGAPATLYRANLSVRAVAVPKGSHTVLFSYEAPGLKSGAALSATALILLLAALTITAHADAHRDGRNTPRVIR